MSTDLRELFKVATPIALVVDEEREDSTVLIKGLASVEVKDRSDDIVPPEEFNVAQFMAAPTMLVNHKYWRDYSGNDVAVGRPLTLAPVRLVKGASEENWDMVKLGTKDVINTFPKQKVPNLKAGDKGLFITAEVSQPEVAAMVKRGELSAFSWRGLASVTYQVNKTTNLTERVFKDIDLYEISLVHIPDQPSSTFIVGKGEQSERPLVVNAVRLDKSRFHNAALAAEFLKYHRLDDSAVREDDNSFFALQHPHSMFNLEKMVVMNMGSEVSIIAGPLKSPPQSEGQRLDVKTVEKMKELYDPPEVLKPEKMVGDILNLFKTKKTADPVEDTMAEETKVEKTEEEVKKEEVVKAAEEKTKALDALGDRIATKTAEALKPCFETVAKSLESVSGGMTAIVEKMAPTPVSKKEPETKTETEKTEAQKSVSDVYNVLNTLAEGILDQQSKLIEVAKTVETLKQVTPKTEDHHVEKKEVEKTVADEDDPNAVLDSIFPFLE